MNAMPIFTAKTVPEAVVAGLAALKLEQNTATITVIKAGKRGFLGIGRQLAQVKIEPKPVPAMPAKAETPRQATTPAKPQPAASSIATVNKQAATQPQTMRPANRAQDEQALKALQTYLQAILKSLGQPEGLTLKRAPHHELRVQLQTQHPGRLIGRHGRTLNALQYLGQVYVNHQAHSRFTLLLNVGEYRQHRQEILKRLAKQALQDVIATGQPQMLDPMPAFERKQVHAYLAHNRYVTTHSEGEEPHRYLVITPRAGV
ncbi:RNA-binding protein [Loigolactobacillus bifermentans DSM 20003]|uniref:RNA-binding protein KhpB n=2 Tax=Loigolactobacillus bifermentans TaxID=1607 RepID=A0A0R1GH29_9LACO|nr:RNA-binding protein [Loigolactobacillus bifermentans DSM 20003]